jgi:RNA polymerase sigma factor (sigma-70 family)
VNAGDDIENLLRRSAPRVLTAILRRYGNLVTAEDAVQEALLAAAAQWPGRGTPDSPESWLITVASRRMTDLLRSEQATKRREERVAAQTLPDELVAPAADAEDPAGEDDTLALLMLCCHPSLTAPSQIAITLRAVGGLTTAEIARAFLVPEATMAQRISRSKQRIKAAGAQFGMPPEHERADRLGAVMHVLYLVFNEGYTATSGPDLHRSDLTQEAIRLTRIMHEVLPSDGEVTGLLALMLLTDSRRPARTRADGSLIPLSEQNRRLWDRESIDEGTALISQALARTRLGPYQLQATIAAVHAGSRRHRLAANRRTVRVGRSARPQPHRHAQPCRRRRHGPRTAGRTRAPLPARDRQPAVRPPSSARGPGTPAGNGRRPRGSPRKLPNGGTPDHQRPRAKLPAGPRNATGPGNPLRQAGYTGP